MGPAFWVGCTCLISFAWGSLYFHEEVHHLSSAIASLLVITMGIVVIASPQTFAGFISKLGPRKAESHHSEANDEETQALLDHEHGDGGLGDGPEIVSVCSSGYHTANMEDSVPEMRGETTKLHRSRFMSDRVLGFSCAVAVALLNGSLMVPLKMCQKQFAKDDSIDPSIGMSLGEIM